MPTSRPLTSPTPSANTRRNSASRRAATWRACDKPESPKRLPPGARLRITTSAPVVIVRGPRSPDVFSYTDAQWVKVVAAHPACNQHQLLVDLEAAGQRYWASRRDPQLQKRLQRGLKQARAHVVLARDAQFPPEIGALAGAVAV